MTPFRKALFRGLVFASCTAIWWANLHHLFKPPPVGQLRRQLLAREHQAAAAENRQMRQTNPEWDFMARTFFAMAHFNEALRAPNSPHLAQGLSIISDTRNTERNLGQLHFLMRYGHRRPFEQQPMRSAFVDGEIALTEAAALLVDRTRCEQSAQSCLDPSTRESLTADLLERTQTMTSRYRSAPAFLLESYPDEAWTFCNTAALTAIALSDVLLRTDHHELIEEAINTLKTRHVDRDAGLLNSRIRFDGEVMEGPEGSSIFFVAHMLQFLDPEFARDQYRRARQHLGSDQWGFAWAREWPLLTFEPDVDSGVSIPLLDISAGASGMAILGASAFSDASFRSGLLTTLYFGAFPLHRSEPQDSVRFAASNRVGDAVLLYSLSLEPTRGRNTSPLLDVYRQSLRRPYV